MFNGFVSAQICLKNEKFVNFLSLGTFSAFYCIVISQEYLSSGFRPGLTQPGCSATEDAYRLEISELGRREIVLSIFSENEVLISCKVSQIRFYS